MLIKEWYKLKYYKNYFKRTLAAPEMEPNAIGGSSFLETAGSTSKSKTSKTKYEYDLKKHKVGTRMS